VTTAAALRLGRQSARQLASEARIVIADIAPAVDVLRLHIKDEA
jgi:hypothetical protein